MIVLKDTSYTNTSLLTSNSGSFISTGSFVLSTGDVHESCGFLHSLYAIMCRVKCGLGSVANPMRRYDEPGCNTMVSRGGSADGPATGTV